MFLVLVLIGVFEIRRGLRVEMKEKEKRIDLAR